MYIETGVLTDGRPRVLSWSNKCAITVITESRDQNPEIDVGADVHLVGAEDADSVTVQGGLGISGGVEVEGALLQTKLVPHGLAQAGVGKTHLEPVVPQDLGTQDI